ncbi:MAG: DUF4421 family protein [Bacteroidaceae bacterium]|nr:DUF4421 family protein [Bacteroidaceae bacterium]
MKEYPIGRYVLLFMALLAFSPARAEGRLKKIWTKVDGILAERYYRTSYDTNYVVRPVGKLTLKLKYNVTGNSIHAKGTVNDVYSRADLSTSHKMTISIGVAYRGLAASYAINPAKLGGSYNDYELNFNYFGSRLSFDASYQRSYSMSGNVERGDVTSRMEQGDVTMKVFNITGYYCFNHHRFSFPAAFNQSYIQRRSAGSWLAGLSYQGGSIVTNEELKARRPEAPEVTMRVGHLGIGGGYGYNLVLGKRWLIHLSALPTFVVYNRNKLTINGNEREAGPMRFNMIFNERAAINFTISPRWFLGATLVMSNSLFDDKNVIINQNKWVARAFVGMRL